MISHHMVPSLAGCGPKFFCSGSSSSFRFLLVATQGFGPFNMWKIDADEHFVMQREEDVKGLNLAALKACGNLRDLESGKRIHCCSGLNNIYLANTVMSMYGKCGSLEDAQIVFERMPQHSVVSWNAMMLGYVDNGQADIALDVFFRMKQVWCTSWTYVAALMACASLAENEDGGKISKLECLNKVKAIHFQAAETGCDSETFVGNTLIDAYAKCGSMIDAVGIFEKMGQRDVVSWTALIMGYAENGDPQLALDMYAAMKSKGCTPDARSYVAALMACTALAVQEEGRHVDGRFLKVESLQKGMDVHCQATEAGYELRNFVTGSLVDMYCRCGSMVDAQKAFDRIQKPDVVLWTTLILGYAENGAGEQALSLFCRMVSEGCFPNSRTYVAAATACTSLAEEEQGKQVGWKVVKVAALEKGMAVHSRAVKAGYDSDMFVTNTLINMYFKCGSLVDARRVFDSAACHSVVSWTALILGYAENGESEVALELFQAMRSEAGCCLPNSLTYAAALVACGDLGALETGRKLHCEMMEMKASKPADKSALVDNCVLDLYCKCGSMSEAERVFDSLVVKDVVAWSSLITGYSGIGYAQEVFDLFHRMQLAGLPPDGVTFLSVLTSCSHAGLVGKAKDYFQDMCASFELQPRIGHYHCMIDLLGRANHLDEAVEVAESMPFEATVVTWTTVLSACRKWKNAVVAKQAFEALVRLDEDQAASYVLMANIFGSVSLLDEQTKVLALARMKKIKIGAWKQRKSKLMEQQRSWWIDDTSGAVHVFNAEGGTRLEVEVLQHEKLDRVCAQLKLCDEEQEQEELCGHTERLALAFALLKTAPGTTIRIVKRSPTCGTCHKTVAFVSKVEQRQVVLRDSNRFHEFNVGGCSCEQKKPPGSCA